MSLEVKVFEVGALQVNCSLIYDTERKEAILIDPGDDANRLLQFIQKNSLNLTAILHTHAHFDHVMGTHAIINQLNTNNKKSDAIKIFLHEADLYLWNNMEKSAQRFGIQTPNYSADVTHYLKDNETLIFNNIQLKVIYTPGHSPGSCSFLLDSKEHNVLFSGDTLFKTSIGRTDLWKGNFDDLMNSIKNKLFKLEKNPNVIPGHGPETTIAHEILNNPFIT